MNKSSYWKFHLILFSLHKTVVMSKVCINLMLCSHISCAVLRPLLLLFERYLMLFMILVSPKHFMNCTLFWRIHLRCFLIKVHELYLGQICVLCICHTFQICQPFENLLFMPAIISCA